MPILFDRGTPKGLARALPGHTIIKAQARGWDKLHNGALLTVAEESGLSSIADNRPENPLPVYSHIEEQRL